MPLLWFRVASDGSPPAHYTLQVPFQLGVPHALQLAQKADRFTFGGRYMELVENQGIQLFRVGGFGTAEEATAFFPCLRGALLHLIVKKKLSLLSSSTLQQVNLKEPPIDVRGNNNFGDLMESVGWTHLDGYIDPMPAVVIPEHLRILEVGGGPASVKISIPVTNFLESVGEILALPKPERVSTDPRLSLSIGLYAASLGEVSRSARVISLATSLEVLIESELVHATAVAFLDDMLKVFASRRDSKVESVEERDALNRLRDRMAGLREESITEGLRRLAANHTTALGESAEDARRNMAAAYNVRSKLVHNGFATEDAIASAGEWLTKAVPAILESLARKAANGD